MCKVLLASSVPEQGMTENDFEKWKFMTIFCIMTHFKTLKHRVLKICYKASESSNNYLSELCPQIFNQKSSSGCKMRPKMFGTGVRMTSFCDVTAGVTGKLESFHQT